ncbi:hypothetical protein PHYSODRAFT_325463 [Phytophthora sojae]|uniref:Uncharacterized protein n=1 Tax=Phytophthora sojae (strain P6497) TaxID=1094619 RepID=G4YV39_PHYSP|nr:hypothetical protein PHYSODRAFT_325463 [Phytophthora sojae]EGZ24338.1 hypothetical protein PHYSODRAFT_325463 [Phytophthora sojae]|eukprot:XP_009519626.1 hypothetical protein PHYSODRAFT_325463 [Phytophthora sojae]
MVSTKGSTKNRSRTSGSEEFMGVVTRRRSRATRRRQRSEETNSTAASPGSPDLDEPSSHDGSSEEYQYEGSDAKTLHNPSSILWSLEEINTIRKKFKCDCKDFYQTGFQLAGLPVDRARRANVSSEMPASVINWSVLIDKTVAEADGEESQRTYVGGKRFWEIAYEDQDEVTVLVVEALARTIDFSFQMGHKIVPN